MYILEIEKGDESSLDQPTIIPNVTFSTKYNL